MILKKPYALFIKLFKPIHLFMAILIMYLIYIQNAVLKFLNLYIYSNLTVSKETMINEIINNFFYIIPLIEMVFIVLFIVVMIKKNKPVKFYITSFIIFVAVIILNSYTMNFLNTMKDNVVSITSAKLFHDLILIALMLEMFSFIVLVVRGLGINFKKFNFDSDISKFEISEEDKAEFELSFNIDFDDKKKERRRLLRNLKYLYQENKLKIRILIVFLVVFSLFGISFLVNFMGKEKTEGNIYETSNFNFMVNSTYILNTDYRGNKLTDDYLLVIDISFASPKENVVFSYDSFELNIGDAIFRSTSKYSSSLLDLGLVYNENILESSYKNYLFVFEISEKYINSPMYFKYNGQGNFISIKLNPNFINFNDVKVSKKIGDKLTFLDSLGDVSFVINSYDISDKVVINYEYCISDNDCISSIEYLRPSIDTNFDKYILALDVLYEDNSNLNMKNFYDFYDKFASIYYKIGDDWYIQSYNFENVISKKVNSDKVYIGINSEIILANEIKLVFNIRNLKYEYILKELS